MSLCPCLLSFKQLQHIRSSPHIFASLTAAKLLWKSVAVSEHTPGDHSAHPEQSFARDAQAANTMAPTDGHRIRLLSRISWNCCRLCDFFWERNTQSKATFGWNGKNRYCHKTWVNLHYPLDNSVNQSTNYCNQSTCQPTNQPANGSINQSTCLPNPLLTYSN